MENLPPQMDQGPKPNIWEQNPKLKGLLLGLIVVLLGSGVVLVVLAQIGNNYRQKIYEETIASLPKHDLNPKPVEKLDPATGLVTFTDTLMGFELKYPQKFKDYTVSTDGGIGFDADGYYSLGLNFTRPLKESQEFVVPENPIYLEVRKNKTIQKWLDEYKEFSTPVPKLLDKKTVGAIEVSVYTNEGIETISKEDDLNWYMWEKDGNLYNLSCEVYNFKAYCDQVVNSFKFLGEQDPAWKTYKNEEYGFEFKYPSNWTVTNLLDSNYNNTKPFLLVYAGKVRDGSCSDYGCPPKAGDRIELSKGDTFAGAPPLNPTFTELIVKGQVYYTIHLTDRDYECSSQQDCETYLKNLPLAEKRKVADEKSVNYNKFIDLLSTVKFTK